MAHHRGEIDQPPIGDEHSEAGSHPGRRPVPRWKRTLIGGALAVAVLGGTGQIISAVRDRAAAHPVYISSNGSGAGGSRPQTATNGRGFVSSDSSPSSESLPATSAQEREHALWEKAAPYVTRFGISFFVGLCIGLMFRVFLKTMAVLTALVVVGLICLSYFRVITPDYGALRSNYDSFFGWAKEHAGAIKDLVLHALPSTTLGVIGFFFGFRRH